MTRVSYNLKCVHDNGERNIGSILTKVPQSAREFKEFIITTQDTPITPAVATRLALAELTPHDLRGLAGFAGAHLRRVGLPTHASEDIVQRALMAVLIGLQDDSRGRHPKFNHLGERVEFIKYLKGVIQSLVNIDRHRPENRAVHLGVEVILCSQTKEQFLTMMYVNEEIAFKELSTLLFERLYPRVPLRLQALLLAWRAEHYDCDHIPLQGCHRRLRAELRTHAAQVIRELTKQNAPLRANPR